MIIEMMMVIFSTEMMMGVLHALLGFAGGGLIFIGIRRAIIAMKERRAPSLSAMISGLYLLGGLAFIDYAISQLRMYSSIGVMTSLMFSTNIASIIIAIMRKYKAQEIENGKES